MVTLNFGTFPKTNIQDGLTPLPKARLNVINPMAEKQRAKRLVPIMTKSREIMWIHLDIVKDEKWEFSKPKLEGKSCNVVSLSTNNDTVTIASLNDLEKEKLSLAAQPAASQPIGTRSGRQYL